MAKLDKSTLNNPLFQTLKQQKEEREYFLALVNEQIQQQDPYYSEDPEIAEEPTESAAFNVFEHTEVDASKITAS